LNSTYYVGRVCIDGSAYDLIKRFVCFWMHNNAKYEIARLEW